VNLVTLSFSDDPALETARHISSMKTERTVVVVPTQRFKTFLGSRLLSELGEREAYAPALMTMETLVRSLSASTGRKPAAGMEKLSMLLRACRKMEGLDVLFPHDALNAYSTFAGIGFGLLGAFREIAGEECELTEKRSVRGGSAVREYIALLSRLYVRYMDEQVNASVYDMDLQLSRIDGGLIDRFFKSWESVVLVSPGSLTRFEKRIFDRLEERLTVIYQDTAGYDFSPVMTFRAGTAPVTGGGPVTDFAETGSRAEQLAFILSLIMEEMDAGTPPHEIAVVNLDSDFSSMLRESLADHGVMVNYSGGLRVAGAPLFRFFSCMDRFFKSRYDTAPFLQILNDDIFLQLADTGESGIIRALIEKDRVFRFPSIESKYIRALGEGARVFKEMLTLYGSKTMGDFVRGLELFLFRFKERRPYAFHKVRDLLIETAIELEDLQEEMGQKPWEMWLSSAAATRYPLLGDYTEGVQILGLLETRGIGFRRVIVPSFNEGFFPVRSGTDFLPPAVRRELGLAGPAQREELEFYYLKRLADGSRRTSFLTIDDPEGGDGTRSRFFYALGDVKRISRREYTLPVPASEPGGPPEPPDPPRMKREITDFSRMDVKRIKECETRYYIRRVLGIREPSGLDRTIELRAVGQIVHDVLSAFYRDVWTEDASGDDLRENLLRILDSRFPKGFFFTREEGLTRRFVRNRLIGLLDRDKVRFSGGYRICRDFIEKPFSCTLGRYTLSGRIDRIDRTPDGGHAVIDYKTGSLPGKKDHTGQKDFRSIQLGFYGLLFQRSFPGLRLEQLCYYDFNGSRYVDIVGSDMIEAYMGEFEGHLLDILDDFNARETLSLADDPETCRYCPYHDICRILEP